MIVAAVRMKHSSELSLARAAIARTLGKTCAF